MASAETQTDNTVIIGIDFGTTFSGVAFTWSNRIEHMEVVASWDSELHSNSTEHKAPTAISFGAKSKVQWGYGVAAEAEQLKRFKLLLIDDRDLPKDVRKSKKIKEAREFLKKHNKTATEVVALFLRHLWNHSIQRITTSIGRSLVNFSKFHVVITLPAIWPEYARARVREAADRAGMLGRRIAGKTALSFVSEPEAAALATLSDMNGRSDIKAGDTFVVVDCGGGTADLISYEVVSTSPMVVKECVKGQGGLCGAVFVDEAFVEVLKNKFGPARWAKLKTKSYTRLMHTEWETMIKPNFDGRPQTWEIQLPFECGDIQSLKDGAEWPIISINDSDVRGAFDSSLDKIRGMVAQQVAAVRVKKKTNPKYIILVGGFGRCKYLLSTLKAHFGGIEILQSDSSKPWTAICRGAVIHAATLKGLPAFNIDVQARFARVSCGVEVYEIWNRRKHIAKDKRWNEAEQKWTADGQMDWLLKAGDVISSDKPLRSSIVALVDTEDATNEGSRTIIIHSSAKTPPPKRVSDASVKELCRIRWDAGIDFPSLPTYTNPLGKVYYELEYEVEMSCVAGSLDFAVYHNGKRQGSKHVVVDYETRS